MKQKSFDDCQHIAAAILAACDIITSWNFKHIVNVKTVRGVKFWGFFIIIRFICILYGREIVKTK